MPGVAPGLRVRLSQVTEIRFSHLALNHNTYVHQEADLFRFFFCDHHTTNVVDLFAVSIQRIELKWMTSLKDVLLIRYQCFDSFGFLFWIDNPGVLIDESD